MDDEDNVRRPVEWCSEKEDEERTYRKAYQGSAKYEVYSFNALYQFYSNSYNMYLLNPCGLLIARKLIVSRTILAISRYSESNINVLLGYSYPKYL